MGPKLPDGVTFDDSPNSEGNYHRGLPYFARPARETRAGALQLRDALPELVATTTLRGLECHVQVSKMLPEILKSPAAAHLSALSPGACEEDLVPALRALISSPTAHALKWLNVQSINTRAAETLAQARSLGRMERLFAGMEFPTKSGR